MNKIIYKLNISGKQAIEHAFKYGIYSERLESRKDAVSRINNFMGYCSRNGLNGVFKTNFVQPLIQKMKLYSLLHYIKSLKPFRQK